MRRRLISSVAAIAIGICAILVASSVDHDEPPSDGQYRQSIADHSGSSYLRDGDSDLSQHYPPSDQDGRSATTHFGGDGYYPTPMLMMALWDCDSGHSGVIQDHGWESVSSGSTRAYHASLSWSVQNHHDARSIISCIIRELGFSDNITADELMSRSESDSPGGVDLDRYTEGGIDLFYGGGSSIEIRENVNRIAFDN